jgi:Glyoxalase/Bleomycin resistance protein/Dioxygenase superfamily
MEKPISGIHHVTAIASNPQRNLDFYSEVLGLRLVKRTVNFDDPGTYHFYFADATGTPGTILTFFPWPGAARGHIGSAQMWLRMHRVPRILTIAKEQRKCSDRFPPLINTNPSVESRWDVLALGTIWIVSCSAVVTMSHRLKLLLPNDWAAVRRLATTICATVALQSGTVFEPLL